MDCEFSEFSYGYAAIREAETDLASVYQSAGVPVLPSLVAEEVLGYDAHLKFVEFALFLQFKRVEFVSRPHPASPTWPELGKPHYRFSIDTDGHQHIALCRLEEQLAQSSENGEVFYAAPQFWTQGEFDAAYLHGDVLNRSSLVRPSEFGLADGVHRLVASPPEASMILSAPRRVKRPAEWFREIAHRREQANRPTRSRRELQLRVGDLEDLVRGAFRSTRPERSTAFVDAPPAQRLQRYAAGLDCALILLVNNEDM